MTIPALRADEAGHWSLHGDLDFSSVVDLWPELHDVIVAGGDDVHVSLAGVGLANSAALALLMEGVGLARRRGIEVHYEDIPESLMALATAHNLANLLAA